MTLSNKTVKQLLLAAALARGMDRGRICNDIGITPGYITQFLDKPETAELVAAFTAMPLDADTKEYKGLGTLYMMIAQLIYRTGEKLANA